MVSSVLEMEDAEVASSSPTANPNTVASHYRRGLEKLRALCAEEAP